MTFKDHFPFWICNIGARWGMGSVKLWWVNSDLWQFSFQGSRSPGFSRLRLSEDASLQFVHSSETLTLTVNHTAEHLLEADIKLFRKYFWDRTFLVKVCTAVPGLNGACSFSAGGICALFWNGAWELTFFFFLMRAWEREVRALVGSVEWRPAQLWAVVRGSGR